MPNDTLDVDKLAEGAERMGLVSQDLQGPEDEADQIVVLVHISGGLVAGVGALRRDIPRLMVIVADDDMLEDGEADRSYWTETPTALEDWGRDESDALVRAVGELPETLRRELGLSPPD